MIAFPLNPLSWSLNITVGPEILLRGPNRTEFQNILRTAVDFFSPLIEEDRVEDVLYQAMDFYYTPWPHIDDGELNRHLLGAVMNTFNDSMIIHE